MAESACVISTFHEPNPEAHDFRSNDPEYPGDEELRRRQAWLKLPPEQRRKLAAEGRIRLEVRP